MYRNFIATNNYFIIPFFLDKRFYFMNFLFSILLIKVQRDDILLVCMFDKWI